MEEYKGEIVKLLCTSKCNSKCEHCLVRYQGARDPDELVEMVKILKKKYHIVMNGAEVLTNPEYLRAYKELGQYWIMTNGLALLDPKVIEALHENGIKSVSMSYHFGMHDQISNVKTDKLKKIIDIVKANGLNFRFLTTISSLNYQLVIPMCEEAYKMGAKGIMFTNLIKQGNGVNLDNSLFLNKEQLEEFFKSLNYVRSVYDEQSFIIQRSGTFEKDTCGYKNHFCCDAGINRVYIGPDNNVYPCVFLTNPGCEIGKYIDGKVMIYEGIRHVANKCIAREICNEGKSFSKVLKYDKK